MSSGLGLVSWWPWQDYRVTVNGVSQGVRRVSESSAKYWFIDVADANFGQTVTLWKRNPKSLLWEKRQEIAKV